jgi:mannose-6-phosphate isomerase-like protein (cupin superfamily)
MAGTTIIRKDAAPSISAGSESLTFRVSSEVSGGSFTYLEGTTGYLGGPPLHSHLEQDEVIHVLEGRLKVQYGTQTADLDAGDAVYIPRRVPHAFTNLDPETPVRMIGFTTPGGFDEFMAEWVAWLETGAGDQEKILEICRRHKMAVSGPPLPVTLGLVPAGVA